MKHSSQRGATLIVILIILLFVMIIGVYAVRQSFLSLNIATNSQAQQLLIQNTDAAFFSLENPTQINRQLSLDGMFGYFYAIDHAQDELVFCFKKNQTNFFSIQNASAIKIDGTTNTIGNSGFCTSNTFSTTRDAILSQVYISKTTTSSTNLFSGVSDGTSIGESSSLTKPLQVSVTIISVLPTFSSISDTQIQNCFKRKSSSVAQCFNEYNVPYNVQHADYTVGSSITSVA